MQLSADPQNPGWVSSLLRQPFRVFFLGAAVFASLGMLIWVVFLHLGFFPGGSLPPLLWHGHEMLFGFAAALMAGFLLTAVANWTGLPTTTPWLLSVLGLLWLAGRIAFLLPAVLPYGIAAAVDACFFPCLAIVVAVPILRSGNRRNLFLVPLLSAFALADILFHLSVAGVLSIPPLHVLLWVVDLLAVLMLVIGGRVIPFFTERRLTGIKLQDRRWLNYAVNGGAALVLLADVALPGSAVLGIASMVLSLLVAARLYGWRPWQTLSEPMLWILHAGYLWLAIGLLLRGVALTTGALAELTALHALTVGALGSLAIGMMTRVALGHTGRPLVAGRSMVVAFVLVIVGALLRVTGFTALMPLAGCFWIVAFAIYLVRFVPVHLGPLRV
jgi:uncharacterized protein involved in response to NO